MSGDTKVIIGVTIAALILLIGAIFVLGRSGNDPVNFSEDQVVDLVVRDDGYNVKGNENSPVEIVEFSDFECPACRDTYPVLKQVMDEYGDRVKFVYQHFPLTQHPDARPAAFAAEAAGLQGKFWEMHDALFDNQDDLSDKRIQELAQEIGLDVDQFNSDLGNGEVQAKVLRDLAEGNRIGVSGTPSIYINGTLYEGLRSVDGLGAVIEAELTKVEVVKDEVIEATGSMVVDGS